MSRTNPRKFTSCGRASWVMPSSAVAEKLKMLQAKLSCSKSPTHGSPPSAAATGEGSVSPTTMEEKVEDLQKTIRLEKLASLKKTLGEVKNARENVVASCLLCSRLRPHPPEQSSPREGYGGVIRLGEAEG